MALPGSRASLRAMVAAAATTDDPAMADSVIRCLPQDRTNGFFVSCFVRGGAAPDEVTASAANGQTDGLSDEMDVDDTNPDGADAKTAAQRRKAKKNKKKNERKKEDKKRKAGEDEGAETGEVAEQQTAKKVRV